MTSVASVVKVCTDLSATLAAVEASIVAPSLSVYVVVHPVGSTKGKLLDNVTTTLVMCAEIPSFKEMVREPFL